MDERAQKDGEKRVRHLLIDQLERLGLMRPAAARNATGSRWRRGCWNGRG